MLEFFLCLISFLYGFIVSFASKDKLALCKTGRLVDLPPCSSGNAYLEVPAGAVRAVSYPEGLSHKSALHLQSFHLELVCIYLYHVASLGPAAMLSQRILVDVWVSGVFGDGRMPHIVRIPLFVIL